MLQTVHSLTFSQSVCKILRSLAMKNQDAAGLNYREFKQRVSLETFNDAQKAMLNTRLDLLESFMFKENLPGAERISQTKPQFADSRKGREKERIWQTDQDDRRRAAIGKANIWSFEPGTLTIVDLSCPFVDESAACALFNICLALFLEERQHSGRIVALDEAHKVYFRFHSHTAKWTLLTGIVHDWHPVQLDIH